MLEGKNKSIDILNSEQAQYREQNDQAQPVLLVNVPSDERHGNCGNRPLEPEGVIAEESPAILTEWHLKEIDQRLTDKEEDKHFRGTDQRLPDFFKKARVNSFFLYHRLVIVTFFQTVIMYIHKRL